MNEQKVLHKNAIDNTSIRCRMKFGVPSRECKNHGICYMRTEEFSTETGKKQGLGFVKIMGNTMEIKFEKASLTQETLDYHFKNDSFVVLEPYFLDPSLADDLAGQPVGVQMGRYAVENSTKFMTVKFNLV